MQDGTNTNGTSDEPRTESPATDWDAIEREYRLGVRPNTAIARSFGITEGAIRKRARVEGWTKDLTAQVKAKADDLVRKREVRTLVRQEQRVTERKEVEIAALQQVDIRMGQRRDIVKARNLLNDLMADIEQATSAAAEPVPAAEQTAADRAKQHESRHRALGVRVANVKTLSEALRNLVALERQAFGIDDAPPDLDGRAKTFLEAMLDARARATGS
jgi:uncharacterized membrane protein YccC